MVRKPALIALFSVIAIVLSGCQTTESTSSKENSASLSDIQKGSSVEELVAALGEPTKVVPFEKDPEHLKILFFEIEKSKTDMTVLRTEEIPYVDPFTGAEKTMEESVLVPQTTTDLTTIQVFVLDDKVLGWKVDTKADSTIAD